VTFAEIAQPVEIVGQHVPVTRRHAVVAHYFPEGTHDIVKFTLVIAASGQFVLKFIEFAKSLANAILIAPAPKGLCLYVVEVFADTLKYSSAPIIAAKTASIIMPSVAVTINIAPRFATPRQIIAAAGPRNAEPVFACATLLVLDADNGHTALPRIAHQVLAAATVHRLEPKIGRVGRQYTDAFKLSPLWRPATQVSQQTVRAANFNLRLTVHQNSDRARTFAAVSSTAYDCVLLKSLGAERNEQGAPGYEQKKASMHCFSPLVYAMAVWLPFSCCYDPD
jgi:hypothetical protein